MAVVLDASIAVAWFLPDESSEAAARLAEGLETADAYVPAIWPLEVGNALLVAEQRKRITKAERVAFLDQLAAVPIVVDPSQTIDDLPALAALAHEHGLSIYDACYVRLAKMRGLRLATFDSALRAAAQRCGVETVP
jgi:predicted nucleic acid-binding protein